MPCIRCWEKRQQCQYMPTAQLPEPQVPQSEQHSSDMSEAGPLSAGTDQRSSIQDTLWGTFEEPPQEDQYGHFHGSASGFAFLQLAKARLACLPPVSLDSPDFPIVNTINLPATLPPKSVADTLIHNYFDFGLTTSRFVHQKRLWASYENLYSNNPDSLPNQDDLALIYMVMALGSHYAQADTVFSGFSARLAISMTLKVAFTLVAHLSSLAFASLI
jgi:hypothetical protein